MNSVNKSGTTIGAALIIAGTCVGAGMLAMPVETGPAGLYPAMIVNALCWLFMVCTGLLFLEATLWMPDGSNVLSMADRFLGSWGKALGGLSFLFLYYCLLIAYIDGGAAALSTMSVHALGLELAEWMRYGLFTFAFAVLVWMGTKAVDRVNWILMVGLVLSYILLIGVGSGQVDPANFTRRAWSLAWPSIPVLFSAYGYHNVIPSLSTYLARNGKKMRHAIVYGMLLPLIIYGLWLWVIIGSVNADGLVQMQQEGLPITTALERMTHNSWIHTLGLFFGFFALVTSLLGVSLSMVDFLGDGFKITDRTGWKRLFLCLLVFIPPLLLAQANPGIFRKALGYAGGFGEAILNGLFPILMVWIGRYRLGLTSDYRLPGGRASLIVLLVLAVAVIILEVMNVIK